MSVPGKSGMGNPLLMLFTIGPTLSYKRTNYVFYTDTAIRPITPTIAGPSINCTANLPLPAGLSLDASSCVISGTPTATTSTITYIISGSNSFGSTAAPITIRIGNTTAIAVYGQGGSFTSSLVNNGGISASSLANPIGIAFDSNDGMYVAEIGNCRTLFFPPNNTTATKVYGQAGSFLTNTGNNGSISADSLYNPADVWVDPAGALYIADLYNIRVLYFPPDSTTASRVYGQSGSFSSALTNNGGISENSLSWPTGIVVDEGGGLYVADLDNNRVLYFPSGNTSATRVYGQGGSFTSGIANNGGISADSLSGPMDITVDSNGALYIADMGNNRVLFFPAGSTTATKVYGQGGSFTTGAANNGGVSASSLSAPRTILVDDAGAIYINDGGNFRSMYFSPGSTTATRVYGQGGSFTSAVSNNGGITADSLSIADRIALDSTGAVYISDIGNSRVLMY